MTVGYTYHMHIKCKGQHFETTKSTLLPIEYEEFFSLSYFENGMLQRSWVGSIDRLSHRGTNNSERGGSHIIVESGLEIDDLQYILDQKPYVPNFTQLLNLECDIIAEPKGEKGVYMGRFVFSNPVRSGDYGQYIDGTLCLE